MPRRKRKWEESDGKITSFPYTILGAEKDWRLHRMSDSGELPGPELGKFRAANGAKLAALLDESLQTAFRGVWEDIVGRLGGDTASD